MQYSVIALASALGLASATVPSHWSSGFSKDLSLQISFTNDPSNGYEDGHQYKQSECMYQPSFAWGDSSGVNTAQKYVIVGYDTTDKDNYYLHYVGQDYQYSNEKTIIESQSQPWYGYWAPGYLGEQKGSSSYSYICYQQPEDFKLSNVPQLGEKVDWGNFESDCGFDKAIAGISIDVNIEKSDYGYKQYQDQYNQWGGYNSYWTYMPQYDQYQSYGGGDYNSYGGDSYNQGGDDYNQYGGGDYNQGGDDYNQYGNGYQQYTTQEYQQYQYTTQEYPAYTPPPYSAPPAPPAPAPYSQAPAPPAPAPPTVSQIGDGQPQAPPAAPYPTQGGLTSVPYPTGGSPAPAATSPLASIGVGAGNSFRDGARVAAAAGGFFGFAALLL